MSQKFQAAVQHRDDVSYVKVSGVVDEDNELGGLRDQVHGRTVVIDLGEVERINSWGVRDWVHWLEALQGRGARIVLVECSPAIVAQINLVNNFTGGGAVKSFYVPYFCPQCDAEKSLLCETAEMGPPPHEPPICRCDECDLVMDFDDMPDSYFAFLASQPGEAEAGGEPAPALQGLAPEDEEASGIRSRLSATTMGGGRSVSGSSLPSVPSLPSLSGGHSPPETSEEPGPTAEQPSAARPAARLPDREPVEPQRSFGVHIFIGLLVAALALLAYVLFGEP